MRKLFYVGIAGIALFEMLNVYFIMPMPGSQRMNSLDLAYFLHTYRWYFRILFIVLIGVGASGAVNSKRKWTPAIALLVPMAIAYFFNFEMSADSMFKQPGKLSFKTQNENVLNDSSIVIGVEYNDEVKAYPIRFIVYHHQVQDTVGGKPMIITYCSVCRTGRVFESMVKGQYEKFRLVGMDHFNAMFEDATTKSWWRQANGEAITGSLKGEMLPEVESTQLTLGKMFELYPHALVMQSDDASVTKYDSLAKFERGKSKSNLTRTDSLSWNDKSWVVGIQMGSESRAYDWNDLKKQHIINDVIDAKPIVLAVSSDGQSFVAFERPVVAENFTIRNDTLFVSNKPYTFSGQDITTPSLKLKKVKAYQEFWHSWRTFHPSTTQYKE